MASIAYLLYFLVKHLEKVYLAAACLPEIDKKKIINISKHPLKLFVSYKTTENNLNNSHV